MINLGVPWHLVEKDVLGVPTLNICDTFRPGIESSVASETGNHSGVPMYIGSVPLKFRPRRSGSHRGEKMRYGQFSDRDRAIARLIAAAPDLLAALVRLLDESPFMSDTDSCECGENGDGRDEHGDVCEHIQAQRAIAKARGE